MDVEEHHKDLMDDDNCNKVKFKSQLKALEKQKNHMWVMDQLKYWGPQAHIMKSMVQIVKQLIM